MARDKLTEYDATAANNTVVGDVNLAENSALPSDMNNAVREVMSHLKGFASGTDAIDALTVTGTVTADSATLSGTAPVLNYTDTDNSITAQIGSGTSDFNIATTTSHNIDIRTNNTRRMVVESDGDISFYSDNGTTQGFFWDASAQNLLVGKTSDAYATAGFRADYRGFTQNTRDGNTVGYFNRLTSDGTILEFSKDSTTVGSINVEGGDLAIGNDDSGLQFNNAANSIRPFNIGTNAASDNVLDLGQSGDRFDDIFATNGTIQTSDQNEKQQIASLTTTEITAAKAISKLFKTFKWKDKVAAKGDAARTHSGVIAQEVQTAMSDAGLDASNYAFWCSDTWWETSTEVEAVEADEEAGIEARDAYTRIDTYQTAEEAPEGATERTRLGIRYPELLAFVGAATEQRLGDIETRLAALEA